MGAVASRVVEDDIPGAAREKAITETLRKGTFHKPLLNVTRTSPQDMSFVEVSHTLHAMGCSNFSFKLLLVDREIQNWFRGWWG